MKLFPGYEKEYERRHTLIWPELSALLTKSGIEQYHIFLDTETNILFAILQTSEANGPRDLSEHPVMKRWWDYMKDIMETHDDNSPVNIPLKPVFSLR